MSPPGTRMTASLTRTCARYRRLFTLVGRTDREVVCAQILRLWAPPPDSRGPRRVLRTRRRTLTVSCGQPVRCGCCTLLLHHLLKLGDDRRCSVATVALGR